MEGITPAVLDSVGIFDSLAATSPPGAPDEPVPAVVVAATTVAPAALDPRTWCAVLDLAPESEAGSLVWWAAQERETLEAMCEHVARADADKAAVRAAGNHLGLAAGWDVFDRVDSTPKPGGRPPRRSASE